MKTATVVIGANFGDEGKGLFTDYFSDSSTTVVRFNGGAQAGHTVQHEDGRRHVFSHFGAGSFRGARTYLSRFFVCNPLLFTREAAELDRLGVHPEVLVDESALVSTPYDMMINQIAEEARGSARHGSVGVGFGETVGRAEETPYALRVADLAAPALAERLWLLRERWLPARLRALGLTEITPQWQARINSPAVLENFLALSEAMLARCEIAPASALRCSGQLVFEGAQGLLLDQDSGFFPHVTRSSTGLRNVVALAQEIGLARLDVLYATRSYLTRHGAGPLPFEVEGPIYSGIHDPTNKPHPFQGSLRFAPLNLDLLQRAILRDIQQAEGRIPVRLQLGVSCMDQLGSVVQYVKDDALRHTSPDGLLVKLQQMFRPSRMLISTGSCWQDVMPLCSATSRRAAGAGAYASV
jgi:adenylosuccinate synthase